MSIRIITAITSSVILVLGGLATQPASAASGLGISVSFDRSEQTDAESSGALWVGVEQGFEATRTIRIQSLSDDITQQIEFEIYDQILIDDQPTTDYGNLSRFSDWVSFSPESSVVSPGEEIEIQMTVKVPLNAADESFDATLRVLGSSVDTSAAASNENAGVQAIIGSRIAIDSKFWLGVGDALELMPNFEILGIDGILVDETKSIRVFFENTGLVPLSLSGRFQLSDPAFADLVFDPIDFRVPAISAGSSGWVDLEVDQETADGFYRTFVTAQHSGVRKTEVFEGSLVFDDPTLLTIPELLWRIGLFIVAGIGLVFGVRLIRAPKVQRQQRPARIKQGPEFVRVPRRSRVKPATESTPVTPRTPAFTPESSLRSSFYDVPEPKQWGLKSLLKKKSQVAEAGKWSSSKTADGTSVGTYIPYTPYVPSWRTAEPTGDSDPESSAQESPMPAEPVPKATPKPSPPKSKASTTTKKVTVKTTQKSAPAAQAGTKKPSPASKASTGTRTQVKSKSSAPKLTAAAKATTKKQAVSRTK